MDIFDIWVNLVALLYKPADTPRKRPARRTSATAMPAVMGDWERVLYVGSSDGAQLAPPLVSAISDEQPRAFAAWSDARASSDPIGLAEAHRPDGDLERFAR